MEAILPFMTAVSGLVIGAIGARYTLRKDSREQREHDDREADRTIELLEKQNSLLTAQLEELKTQGVARENEWRRREGEWRSREKTLEARINDLERDYRNMVLTVTTMGFCANSSNCQHYNPGDRRNKPISREDDPDGK